MKKSIVIHPFLFAFFPIFFLFSYNINTVLPEEIILPSLIMLFGSFILWITIGFVLKNWKKSGLIVTLGLVLFFLYGHIYIFLIEVVQAEFVSHLFLLSVFLVLFIIGTYFFIRTKKNLFNVTTILNGVVISLIVLSSINITTFYFDNSNFFEPLNIKQEKNAEVMSNIEDSPDIYFIILDEYADADMLKEYLNYDNQEFISFLEENGFFVASESFSNYPRTRVSVPSTLNMEYLHLYYEELEGRRFNDAALHYFIYENAEVINHLKSKNYTIVTFSSAFDKYIKTTDLRLCYFDFSTMNFHPSEFVALFVKTTMLNPIHVNLLETGPRASTLCTFSGLTKVPDLEGKPKFVFAHIMMPHQPYVFGPNGERLSLKGDEFSTTFNGDLYIGQLQFVNKKMKEIILKLLDTDDPPVIIILSDHGFRHGKNIFEKPTKEFLEKRYNNFKAYYFPGKERNLLFEETTNVNVFRVFFNLYFNDKFEILEDKIFSSRDGKAHWLNYTDVTKILFEN